LIHSTSFWSRAAGLFSFVVLTASLGAAAPGAPQAQGPASDSPAASLPVPAALTQTPRPRLPADLSLAWLAPGRQPAAPTRGAADFAAGMRLFAQGKYAQALPLLSSPVLGGTPLASYGSFYSGLCYLNLSRAADARAIFAKLRTSQLPGFLSEASVLREAEASALLEDYASATKLYQDLAGRKTANPDAVLLALGKAQQAAGERTRAAETFALLYYEFPLSELASVAATELDGLNDLRSPRESRPRFKLDLGRAERLFGFKRYQAARDAFQELASLSSGDEAELVALRLAECDHFLKRYKQAREQLTPYLERAARKAEAQFFYLTATRELGDHDEYVRRARALVDEFPASSWAEEALNNLATHYILADEDDQAEAVFREMLAKYPQGPHAERAAWKAGWAAYRHGAFQDAVKYFEGGASNFPRSDYRPAFLYWSGRARGQLSDAQGAASLYRVVTTDYLNTYYGRLAAKRVQGGVRLASDVAGSESSRVAPAPASAVGVPANAELIRLLLSLELYDQAKDELQFALRTSGDSPVVNATLAWLYNKQGDFLRGIIYMKRAYPQYMSDEGARLPIEMRRIVFPLDYWTLIKKYSTAHSLDPYLVAALINQESAFDAGVKSAANAIGLMQVLPSLGKQYARQLKIRRFSAASLTRAETNIQIGTAYFADLIQRRGGIPLALASYNAGESRVSSWNTERPGLELDEYIDDIPFPETQTYVRRILGTAEDYRVLYADDASASAAHATASKPAPSKKPVPAKPATNKKKPKKK
jgi:soluble lytic murein transglycosylase